MTWVLILWGLVDPGIKLRLSGLMANTFTACTTSQQPNVLYLFFPDILFYVYERVVYLYICMCAVHRSEEGVGVKDDCEPPCQC